MCQGDGGSRFSNATLLVCDSDHCGHGLFLARINGTELQKITDTGWVEPPIGPGTITDLVASDLALSGQSTDGFLSELEIACYLRAGP
jgi:hypothetical protein